MADGQAAVKASVASVGSDLSDADERLTEMIRTLGTDLDGLKSDLTKTASDVRTNKTGIADGVKGLASANVDLDAVTAQSGDLKASFLLTRDDVSANAATIEARQTRSLEVERLALVAHLFHLWVEAPQLDTISAIGEAPWQSIGATGDLVLEAS